MLFFLLAPLVEVYTIFDSFFTTLERHLNLLLLPWDNQLLEHFGVQVEMWKLCSRRGGSIIFEETGGPEQPQMHHCEHLFFCMRFGKHFLQKLADSGFHWGPFGEPWGTVLLNF